jgi:hypothetical protein
MRWLASQLGWEVGVYVGRALHFQALQSRLPSFSELPSRQARQTPADIGLAFEAIAPETSDNRPARRIKSLDARRIRPAPWHRICQN